MSEDVGYMDVKDLPLPPPPPIPPPDRPPPPPPEHWVQKPAQPQAPLPDWLRGAPPAPPLEAQPVSAVDSLSVYLPPEKPEKPEKPAAQAGGQTPTAVVVSVRPPAPPVAAPVLTSSLMPPFQRGRSLLPGSSGRRLTNQQTASLSPVSRIRPRASSSHLAAAAAAAAGDVPSSPEAGLLRPRANPREFLLSPSVSPSRSSSPVFSGRRVSTTSGGALWLYDASSGDGTDAMGAALSKLSVEPRATTPGTPRSSRPSTAGATTPAVPLPTLSPAALANGYFCAPSLEALAKAVAADAGALNAVDDFIVGCQGAGSVRFLAPVDLSGAPLLDRIVQLAAGSRTVSMFMHAEGPAAPPAGKGLNVAFEAVLLRVFPRHGTLDAFRAKLRRAPGTRFVSYDGADGTWRFRCDPE
jgi:hypothetical protein